MIPCLLLGVMLLAGKADLYSQMAIDVEHNSWHPITKMRDSGKLKKGIPDGEWKGWYANGSQRYLRTYSHDKYERLRQEVKKHPRFIFIPLAIEAKNDRRKLDLATNANYSIASAPFEKCLHDGLYINYSEDGMMLDSGYYKYGLREGHWEEWNSTEQTRLSGAYRHGRKTGSWTATDKTGKTRSILQYNRKGELVHQKFYE